MGRKTERSPKDKKSSAYLALHEVIPKNKEGRGKSFRDA